MDIYSDQTLISSYLKGEEKALEILIKRYLNPIYNFVYRYINNSQEAEDITQEVFLKVWRNLKKYDVKKSFRTWIFQIAKNACLDFLKKKKLILFSELEDISGNNTFLETLIDPKPLPDELFEQADLSLKLKSAINLLMPKYRLVLFLRYNDHFTFKEIAEILNEPLNTIKSRHQRAIMALRHLLLNP